MTAIEETYREQEIIEAIKKVLAAVAGELRDYRVLLFGSRAAGTARERSDFDVGVYGSNRLPLATFFKIDELLDGINTLYTIDWVDLMDVSESFRKQALSQTVLLHG